MFPYGLVVQLVRTLACHARGQGFESPSGRRNADLAHLVERNLAKVEVAGSTPVIRSIGSLAQLGEHLPYKQEVIGSIPIAPTIRFGSSVG